MKKGILFFVSLCIVMSIVIGCTSCGSSKKSNLSISKLETSLRKTDSSLLLIEESSDGGYTYTATTDFKYTVKADKDKNVTSVKIESKINYIENMQEEASLKTIINKNSSKITRSDLEILNSILLAGCLKEALGGSEITEQETLSFFSAQTPWVIGDWTVKADYSENNLIISAVYN